MPALYRLVQLLVGVLKSHLWRLRRDGHDTPSPSSTAMALTIRLSINLMAGMAPVHSSVILFKNF